MIGVRIESGDSLTRVEAVAAGDDGFRSDRHCEVSFFGSACALVDTGVECKNATVGGSLN